MFLIGKFIELILWRAEFFGKPRRYLIRLGLILIIQPQFDLCFLFNILVHLFSFDVFRVQKVNLTHKFLIDLSLAPIFMKPFPLKYDISCVQLIE